LEIGSIAHASRLGVQWRIQLQYEPLAGSNLETLRGWLGIYQSILGRTRLRDSQKTKCCCEAADEQTDAKELIFHHLSPGLP
jgi:hypothetical protein